jgi:hypothetical protein
VAVAVKDQKKSDFGGIGIESTHRQHPEQGRIGAIVPDYDD